MATELPLVDAGAFNDNSWHKALDAACESWGCFHLVGHGVSEQVLDGILEAMAAFFTLSASEKQAIERTRDNPWGFFDRELTKNVRDWKEIFDVGPSAAEGPLAGSEPQWPALAGFQEAVEAYYTAAEQVAVRLLEGISTNLGMAPGHLSTGFQAGHTSFLRLNYYPLCDAPTEHLGISHHTDAGALTVLLADSQPGLQFQKAGEWHTVAPVSGALTINIGDIVQVWSNDRYRAPLHRVLAHADAVRYSAPFFYNPGYNVDYAPLPGALGPGEQPLYRPINWGEFRAGRAAGDYANYGEEIQISQFRTG
ncbi:MAG: 2OG-Fe(II) oxygenase family protein [Pseudomonadota bacterium]